MVAVDDMKSCIQEWFAQEMSMVAVAKLYHEIVSECDTQLEYMLKCTSTQEGGGDHNG